jgi:hypothetical protein
MGYFGQSRQQTYKSFHKRNKTKRLISLNGLTNVNKTEYLEKYYNYINRLIANCNGGL